MRAPTDSGVSTNRLMKGEMAGGKGIEKCLRTIGRWIDLENDG
jgi:hypothetical protein